MMRKFLALLCIVLFVSTPLASSAELVGDAFKEQDTGASIAVNVRSYEPTVLTSNLIEDNDIPVYVYLAGASPGTALGTSLNVEPLYGGLEIEKMRVKPLDAKTNDLILGEPKWFKPNKFDVDTLGYLTVTLKRFNPDNFEICSTNAECDSGYTCETGACIPTQVNLSFSAEIYFKQAERLFSLAKSALILPVDSDEDAWAERLDTEGATYSFYGGRGLIRVKDITSSDVDLTVYSNKDLHWPIIGAPRALEDLHLNKGETSDYIDLGFTDAQVLPTAKFRVTLNDIRDPAQQRARVAVTINGVRSELTVTKGASLYPGSTWVVKDISIVQGRSGYEYTLTLKDSRGNVRSLVTSQAGGLEETESAFLNKIFYERGKVLGTEEQGKALYYDLSKKSIQASLFGSLDEIFRDYGVVLDVSAVESDTVKTNAFTFVDGITLKDVLRSILPAGYYYSVGNKDTLVIKKFSSVDPCLNAEIYTPDGLQSRLQDVSDSETLDNTLKKNILCTGIQQFQDVVSQYDQEKLPDTGTSVVEESYLQLAASYDAIEHVGGISVEEKQGAEEGALAAYQKLVALGSKVGEQLSFQTQVTDLQNALYGDTSYGTVSLEDNGQEVFTELLSVQELGPDQLSSAVLSKNGVEASYSTGGVLFASPFTETTTKGKLEYNWYVSRIDDGFVQVRKVYTKDGAVASTKTISLNSPGEVIEKTAVQVKRVDTKKEAYLTITPGTGDSLLSRSNFSIHIPIESRAIDLNPDKIDDRIAKAKALQEKLDSIVASLEKIVRTWNYVCLGVFAFVSVKSSFFSDTSVQTRHDVIHGVDDQSGWSAYCEEQSGVGKNYQTFDDCMQENAGAIQTGIDAANSAEASVEALDGKYDDALGDLTQGYNGSLVQCEDLLGDDVFLDDAGKPDYLYLKQLQENTALSPEVKDSVQKKIDSYLGKDNVYQKARQKACIDAVTSVNSNALKYQGKSEDETRHIQQEIASGAYESSYFTSLQGEKLKEIPSIRKFPSLTSEVLGIPVVYAGRVFTGGTSKTSTVYTSDGKILEVQDLTVSAYDSLLGSLSPASGSDAETKITNDRALIAKDYTQTGRNTEGIEADTGEHFYFFKDSAGKYSIYVGSPAYTTGVLSEKYADNAQLEVYSSGEYKGLPYCLPYKNGNFIKFLSYTKNNEIDEIQYWNVGSDGQLCSEDDVLVAHQSELFYNTADPSYNTLVSFANKWVKKTYVQNEKVEINKHIFTVGYGKSKTVLEGATASCYDVLDPQDCRLMFNSCDPVMCPPSRFNFGGRWQVDNVVESGIIGSVVLPQGSGDVVPVCLTGVLASLHFWKSMLDGYVDCLESAKYEGKSVGICDKIRSVYVCELLVREAAAIMDNNKDGLLDFLATKAYNRKDAGGGEYFKFKENLQNMQDAVTYFTTEYATNAFGAFKGRSLDEVGTTLCKQALYAKTPWFSDFMQQVTTPEDPNQFYATLTVRPYAPSIGSSAYQTYYHIYAGNNPNIPNVVYKVYLKNSLTGEVFYTTESCGGVASTIELTDMRDQTLDCIAPDGFDTVCVDLNGETHCGFGSVSTAFSSDYLKDSLVADEVQRNIKTEEDCYPSYSRASPTVSSLASFGTTQSVPLPSSYGELSTGVQRVCSLDNPGLGQGNKGSWVAVGTCGKDADERSLGTCWLNTDSFSIQDAEKNAKVSAHLEQENFENQKTQWGVSDLLDATKSKDLYYSLGKASYNSCSPALDLLVQYKDLFDRTLSYTFAAAAQYQLGVLYYSIATQPKLCGLKGREALEYTATFGGDDLGGLTTIPLPVDSQGRFEVVLGNVQEGDTVTLENQAVGSPVSCAGDDGTATCTAEVVLYSGDEPKVYQVAVEDADGAIVFSKDFTFTTGSLAPEQSYVSASDVCQRCGVWPFCTLSECHGISTGCYYDTYNINECFACSDLSGTGRLGSTGDYDVSEERCAALSGDESQCQNKNCYSLFLQKGESCSWDASTGTCTLKGVAATEGAGVTGTTETRDFTATATADELRLFMQEINDEKKSFGGRRCSCGDSCEDYAQWISRYADSKGIDPLLFLSVMMQESSCNQDGVVSSSGCVGLMQICSFAQCGYNDLSLLDDSGDAERNIECGAVILGNSYASYSQGQPYSCTGITYTGWEAALRGYIGYGCESQNYVEEVVARYDELRTAFVGR